MAFIFDPSKGETPESIRLKRALAARLMGEIGTRPAKNVGEGIGNALASIGQGIAANVHNRRASKAEEAGLASAAEAFNPVLEAFKSRIGLAAPQDPSAYAPQGMDPASARVAGAHGDMKPYLDALASIESAGSGDYTAIGPTNDKLGRALGRYQVMEANIGPWSQEALGRAVSPDEFLANPEIQDAVAGHRFQQYMQQFGSPDLAAQAWFAGPGGVGTNRKDVLGTSVPEYARRFNGALAQSPQNLQAQIESLPVGGSMQMPAETPMQAPNGAFSASPVQMAQSGMPEMAGNNPTAIPAPRRGLDMETLIRAASNPWLNEGQRSVINMLIQQQMQAQDPMRRLDMGIKQEQLNQLRNPTVEPTDTMRNLEWRAQQAGLVPGTPEYTEFMVTGGRNDGVTVNVGGDAAPGLGKLSPDYGYVLDPQTRQPVIDPATGLPQAAPVPGSPAAREIEAGAQASEDKDEQTRTWNAIVDQEIGRALDIIENARLPTTGMAGDILSGIGGTAARDLRGLIDTVKANAGFDRLQAMRDASPTGGALGQVSERELAFLQSTIGNLEQSQSREQLVFNLRRLQRLYKNMLEGRRAYDGLLDEGGEGKPLSEMTDEELEAIINGNR